MRGPEFVEVPVHFFSASLGGSLKHHVLKKVRDAHKFGRLIACARLHKKTNGGGVRGGVDLSLDLETIWKARGPVGNHWLTRLLVHRRESLTSGRIPYTATSMVSPSPEQPVNPQNPSADAVARTVARHPRPLGGDTQRSAGASRLELTSLVINNREEPINHLRIQRKPDWLRARVPGGEGYERLKSIIDEHKLHTVCQEASCPNMGECWGRGTATIMILGDICTRACGFCNIKTGKPATLDLDEPRRVAASLKLMKLKHVVITSVNRDELSDGGANIWAETVRRVHDACPEMSVEILVGDFQGDEKAIQTVCDARPEIISHNMETVRRMHAAVRPQAKYERSLAVLQQFKASGLVTKTGIMLGIGEHDNEVLELLSDVRTASDADIITIGQYLQPTRNHLPIDRWVHPDQFAMFRVEALARGFKVCESGPLVRSSYHAEEQAAMLSGAAKDTHDNMNVLIAKGRATRQ